jgi:iron complex transport system substrate-binding protein
VYLSARPDGYWLYGSESGPAKILYGQLGFRLDPLLGSGQASLALSLERLPELTAEHIFLSEDDPERARELRESPLFERIPAVREGRVYTVDRDLWLLGHSSPLGAELIVGDILEFVIGERGE